MKTITRLTLVTATVLVTGSLSTSILGCASPAAAACTVTGFISPTTATLDHTVAGNSVGFSTGYHYSSNCAVPATSVSVPATSLLYTFNLSDTTDATVLPPPTNNVVSCTNAALNPITVYTTVATYPAGSSPTAPPTYVPSGLPSATLICK